MAQVLSFKMPFANPKFNANQRVWVCATTGDDACLVKGKFRGSGRYVKAWVNWSTKCKQRPVFQLFDVDDGFVKKHGLLAFNDENIGFAKRFTG